ncbi:unnamed protein product, partial [Allacma fusca]
NEPVVGIPVHEFLGEQCCLLSTSTSRITLNFGNPASGHWLKKYN